MRRLWKRSSGNRRCRSASDCLSSNFRSWGALSVVRSKSTDFNGGGLERSSLFLLCALLARLRFVVGEESLEIGKNFGSLMVKFFYYIYLN